MRILVVEDDRRLAASLGRGLREAGFAVDSAYGGEQALTLVVGAVYDVVVLDVMLPGVDGVEVCRRLRARRTGVPILMLTARDALDDKIAGFEAGADDYLVKPFAFRELTLRIRALNRRHLPDRTGVLARGPIELDTGAHRLSVGGAGVELSAREYAVLEYFMLNPGQLLSRGQIMDHVWNYDFEGGPNLIEVYVSRLRRKITDAGAPDPFVTIRGAGYRFEIPEEALR